VTRRWVPLETREEVVSFVGHWAGRTGFPVVRFCGWLGLPRGRLYEWRRRRGAENRHNAAMPKDGWLLAWEKEAIAAFALANPGEGYRRLAYMMIDANVVAATPSSVYRVLKSAGIIGRSHCVPTRKGTGFRQPGAPHRHWHVDVSYINVCGTFYYLCAAIDGWSRYIVSWDIRPAMKEADIEIVIERGRERFPGARPRIISDNGPQFIAREFKDYIRAAGMTHVRTSPYYPQSNGKIERWNGTLKRECIRPKVPLSLGDARRLVDRFVAEYNTRRLHSAIGYIAPIDKLEGRAETILAARKQKLSAAKETRKRAVGLTQPAALDEQKKTAPEPPRPGATTH